MTDSESAAAPPGAHLAVVLMGLLGVAFSALYVAQSYVCDDAFITFRHVRHLVEGYGLVYNPGERVEGYTNFLWGMLVYPGLRLGIQPIDSAQWLSLAAQFSTVLLVYRMGRRLGAGPWQALLAPGLLLGNVAFLTYPMTGMETSFHALLVVLSLDLLVARRPLDTRRSLLLGLVWLALATNRFDGFVLVGMFASWQLLVRRELRSTVPALAVCLAGLLAYNGWRYSFYGLLLPNTVYAKSSLSFDRVVSGIVYVGTFAAQTGVALALAAVPLALRRGMEGLGLLAWLFTWQAAYAVLVGGDWMPHHRFLLPVLPALYLLTQAGLLRLAREATGLRPLGAAAVLLAVLTLNALPIFESRELTGITAPHFKPAHARIIGERLEDVLPVDKLVAIEYGGIVPYYTNHRVLDTFGLTDREIAHSNLPRNVLGVEISPEYLARRGPEAIIFCVRTFGSEKEAWASVRPGGRCHYGYFMKMAARRVEYKIDVFELEPGLFWPVLLARR